MHWVSTCALVLFVVLCVAILPAVLFNTILIPSQNTEPAPGSTEDESGPYYPSTCPNNGSPLAAPQGNCNGQSSSNVKIKFGCTQTNLTCQHLTQWSLTKVAQPSVTLGTNEIRTHVPMFSISAQPSSAGFVFKANFQMSLDNDKKCEAKIASILILLQQITTRTSENGYGEACNQKHVWAVAGSENPVTAGKCNSPGLAQICTGSGSSKCNVTIPYISNSIWVGNSLVNLTNLTLPAMLKNPLVLNTTVYFQLSDANATLIQANPNRYVIDVLISYDSCCNKTSTCAIDIDCDGIKEALATAQATLPLNPLLSSICKNSTEQCGQVTIKDVPQPLMTNNSNMNCLISGNITNPFSGAGLVLTNGSNTLIYGNLACDMTLCSCAGNGQSSNTITNMVTLTGSNCVHPITNLSLITFNATATFTSTCPYLTPINCVVNDWTAWSVDVPCGVNNNPPCAVRSKRNRTITTYPCHGGAQCPVLSDIKNEPCSDTCMFMAPECNNVFECNTVDVCNTTKVCNTFPNTLMHCDNGVSQPCLTTQTIDVTPCSSDCIYNGPLCGTTPCDLNSCMTTTECANYPTNPSYCDNGQSLLCPVNPSGSVDPCSTDCTYYNNAPDCNTGICDPLTCLATRKCSTMPDTVTQCINGASLTCTIYTDTINVSCVTSCIYNDWTAWSAFDTCSPINPQDPQSLCSQSQNRTRTLAAVCPNTVENVASCINVLDNNTMACACTMVPTPLPPPPPQCLTSQDCPTSPALCSEAVCQGGSCYIQLKTCPDLDLCNVGGCDSNTGLCTHTSTVCNDNNPCTSDTCSLVTGECVYTEISAPYNNSCTTYYCNPLTGSGTSTPMVCPPGEYCTQYDPQSLCRPNCVDYTNCTFLKNPNDKCYYGVCAGTQCLLNVNFCFGGGYCDSTTGGCVNTAPCGGLLFCPPGQLANFTTCTCYDDPAQCVSAPCSPAVYNTTSQTCNKTVITNCPSDNNLCTIDPVGCDPILGCSPSRYQSILCPIETCKISSCSPALGCQLTPVICPSDNNSLTNDVCNPFGVCEYNYICDDHNVCTVDSFTNGVCSNIRDATCCYNNSQCASNQCNKANPFNLTGTCAPNIVISGCFGNNTPCIPSDVCATSAGICINGFCTDYSNCNFAVTSFCDSTICTPTGCQYVKSDPKCIGTFSSTTKFCDPFNCADSATHCAVCPNDSQSQLGGLFDLGCTCF